VNQGISGVDFTVMCGYFAVVVAVGIYAGRFTRSTSEFFFAGQRFSWWLVAISCVATLVGSYSFQSYSQVGFLYGFASMMPYMNDWFILPVFLVAWLPIIYYTRVQSIPEYFEKRFDRPTRLAVLVLLLMYLEVYVGINLLTIGQILYGVFRPYAIFETPDLNILFAAALMALIAGVYLHHGGQTSVLMTDLVQGFLLLLVGLSVFGAGIYYLGGFADFWQGLPQHHRYPLAQFNDPPGLHAVGDFWNDAIIGTFAFYCINQGVLMRFLCVKSVHDGRKAMLATVIILMPIAAVAVAGAGWVGRSMYEQDQLHVDAATLELAEAESTAIEKVVADQIFVNVARQVLSWPGMFGLVMAAVVAALMSTLDTLITAVSAVAVNDIWRPLRPGHNDAYYLRAARFTAITATIIGLAMIPVGTRFETIYQALSMFTSVVIPPLVTVTLLAVFTERFTARSAFWTLVLGSLAMFLSLFWLDLIVPFAHGVDPSGGFPYMRGLFGVIASSVFAAWFVFVDSKAGVWEASIAKWARGAGVFASAVGVGWFAVTEWPGLSERTQYADKSWAAAVLWLFGACALVTDRILTQGPRPQGSVEGYVMGSLDHARERFKGGELNDHGAGTAAVLDFEVVPDAPQEIRLPRQVAERIHARPGDMLYIADARWWLGGFRSLHARAGAPADTDGPMQLNEAHVHLGHLRRNRPVRVEKVM